MWSMIRKFIRQGAGENCEIGNWRRVDDISTGRSDAPR